MDENARAEQVSAALAANPEWQRQMGASAANDATLDIIARLRKRAKTAETARLLDVASVEIQGSGEACPTCHGWGLRVARRWLLERGAQPCWTCGGKGWLPFVACPFCGHLGPDGGHPCPATGSTVERYGRP